MQSSAHLRVTCSVQSEDGVVTARVLVLAGWECGQSTPDTRPASAAVVALGSEACVAMDSYVEVMGAHAAATGSHPPALHGTALPGGYLEAGRGGSAATSLCGRRKRAWDDIDGGEDAPHTAWPVA